MAKAMLLRCLARARFQTHSACHPGTRTFSFFFFFYFYIYIFACVPIYSRRWILIDEWFMNAFTINHELTITQSIVTGTWVQDLSTKQVTLNNGQASRGLNRPTKIIPANFGGDYFTAYRRLPASAACLTRRPVPWSEPRCRHGW